MRDAPNVGTKLLKEHPMGRPRGRPRGGGNPNLAASKEEVLAFFDERIRHYQQLKEMYLNNELNAWRRREGSLTFEKR